MELLGALGLSLALACLTQIPWTSAEDCSITYITSKEASSLSLKWNRHPRATSCFLDLRVAGTVDVPPVVVTLNSSVTEKNVFGLKPATKYNVILKCFEFYTVICQNSTVATTVPGTTQITFIRAISSTAIKLEWASVYGAERFYVVVESIAKNSPYKFNESYTVLTAVVGGLKSATSYNCSVYTANIGGMGASSKVWTITTLTRPPVPVTVTQIGETTAHVSWEPVEKVILYKIMISDRTNKPLVKDITETFLSIPTAPCTTYYFSVSSYNPFLETGESTNASFTSGFLRKSINTSVDYTCGKSIATVTWGKVYEAESFEVVAVDSHNMTLSCTTQSTSCEITGVQCGEWYTVHVTAVSSKCNSMTYSPVFFGTVPCAPTSVNVFRECSSNLIILSWAPTNNTDYYRAISVDSFGNRMTCVTGETACFFTNTVCGRGYQFTVYAMRGICSSKESLAVVVRTAPCQPDNVRITSECYSDTLVNIWDMAAGAKLYVVEAMGNTPSRNMYNCTSTGSNCSISGVQCGESLSVWITTLDDDCSSGRALGEVGMTVPCIPQNVSAVLDCASNSITMHWEYSHAASFYIGSVVGKNGMKLTCNTTDTRCVIQGLSCGQNYSAYVIAANKKCKSNESTHVIVETGTCPPHNIKTSLDCTWSEALIEWESSKIAVSYTAIMEDDMGALLTCSSLGNSCRVPGLKCGQVYKVSVVAHYRGTCPSVQSKPTLMNSVSCGPNNVHAAIDCGTRTLDVKWDAIAQVDGYVAVMTTEGGEKKYCNTITNNCTTTSLSCGQSYTVVVMSVNGTCQSWPSKTLNIQKVPCAPTNVTATRSCNVSSVSVMWVASPGALYYKIIVRTSSRHVAEWASNKTSFSIPGLQCGEVYAVAVAAVGSNCTSYESQTIMLQTAPCAPANVTVQIGSLSNHALVSWNASSNAVSYTAKAVGQDGNITSCNSRLHSCNITGLRCSNLYTFTVSAQDGTCQSPESAPLQQYAGVCPPENLSGEVICSNNTLRVTWKQSVKNGVKYFVLLQKEGGSSYLYTTSDTSFQSGPMQCGERYSVQLSVQDTTYNSSWSTPITLDTVQCPPTGLKAQMDYGTQEVQLSWVQSISSVTSIAVAVGDHGHKVSCSSNTMSCYMKLDCGHLYTITVYSGSCNSSSPAFNIDSGSCYSGNITADVDCKANAFNVQWAISSGENWYTALAISHDDHKASCSTNNTACIIQDLQCGQTYGITVITSNTSASISSPYQIQSVPCEPLPVETHLDCESGNLSVSWPSSSGANRYWAEVKSDDFQVLTCKTISTSCFFPRLQCGHNYSVTVVAGNNACNSSYSTPKHIATAPCPPSNVITAVSCDTNLLFITWSPHVQGAWYITTVQNSNGNFSACNTTGPNCTVNSLQCGKEYRVKVTAEREGCTGTASTERTIRTVPCIPTLSDVKVNCRSDFALVQWKKSMGAEQYKAVAENVQGNTTYCSTSNSSCIVSGLQCGQLYTVTVIASDQQCNSGPSNAIQPGIAPCPPRNVLAKMICGKNTVTVSWSPSYGALNYTVMLNDKLSCTTESLSCDIGSLSCGGVYVVTLVAHGSTCDSLQSMRTRFSTEPCAPENLNASLSCYNNEVTATWTNTWRANFYLVEAIGSNGHTASCTSAWSSCQLTSLYCGQNYTITVKAHEATCYSAKSTSVNIRTAPCTPRNATTYLYCNTRAMTISWKESDGADSYIATVEDDRGFFTNCQAMGTNSCNVTGLDCGMIYKATVVASNGYCDSVKSSGKEVHSVPCVPTNIKAYLDCEIKTTTVTWAPGTGARSYIVSAQTHSGHMATCSTEETNCEMSGLFCGEFYSVSVLAVGQTCNSSASMTKELMTQPCVPLIAKVHYQPSTGQVFWHTSNGASSYSVEAVTSQGLQSTCNTKDTNCTLYDMSCGQVYNITVTAISDACKDIVTSDPISLVTEPCQPKDVQVHLDCKTNEGKVSWEESSGDVDYVAMFAEQNGHTLSCNTMGTSCKVGPLRCGTVYHVSVQALGPMYNSSESTLAPLVSAPCTADNLDAHVDCKEDTALVSWSFSDGAEFYRVSARSTNGDTASCESLPTDPKNFCILSNLTCGTNYTLHLVSANKQCEVLSPDEVSIQTKPCPPTRVDVDLQCGNNTAVLHWCESDGVEHYIASAKPSVDMNSITCNTTTSSCVFADLDCKMSFAFTVTAYSKRCQSEPSKPVEITTEPCQPQSVTVEHACNNDTVTVQWQNVRRADYYMVTVDGDLGYVVESKTPYMTLETMILCGQSYTISVRGRDNETCDGPSSDPVKFRADPCIPQTVQTYIQCENNMGAVVWAESEGAESYMATAMGQHGHIHMCTTTGTNCTWDNLHCSDSYTINIVAVDSQCYSLPSSNSTIYTAPCPPHGLKATLNCSNKVVSLSWDASEMTRFYTAAMYKGSQKIVELSTNETLAYFSEISCSQQYSFTVTAWRNKQCRSTPSSPTYLNTEPCSPSHVVPMIDCIASSASVTWAPVHKAMYYVATFQTEDGQSQNCLSPSTACSLPTLPCGRTYSVFVTAVNDQCNSIPSTPIILHTVPCVPEAVSIMVDCMDDKALVSWNRSEGALYYRAIAKDSTGIMVSCESTDLHCKLISLPCSTAFTVNVTAVGLTCSSFPSETAHFQTVPCTPEINSLYLDCFTNSLMLQWGDVRGATSYTALAESRNHGSTSCKTNNTNCEIEGLFCGQMYTVRLLASDEQCNSSLSTGQKIASVPCIPQNVKAQMNCSGNMAYVEWEGSSGAESYVVNAFGIGGYSSSCSSIDSACQVLDLLCGDTYNISVVAISQDCNISESSAVELQSVPCAPGNVTAYYDCDAREVVVSWEASFRATSYYVIAEAAAGYNSSCNTSDTVCRFGDFLCSMPYHIYVIATDDICSSLESDGTFINTAACEPENVSAWLDCDTNTGVVTWEEVDGVDLYNVLAMGRNWHFITCSNVSTACSLPGLECDQVYDLTVTTIDYVCNNSNAYLSLKTMPCEPSNLNASTCISNSTWVTWIGSSLAQSYEAVGKGTDGHEVYSITNTTSAFMSGLKCGQNYCIAVSSIGNNCTSNPFTCLPVQTVPCPPQSVTTRVNCESGIITVSWNPDSYADYFHVLAVANDGTQLSCGTNGTWCPIGPAPCGLTYTIRITAYSGGCYSLPSLPVQESSAPCMPKDVSGNLSCMTNSVWVKWKPARGAKIYTVSEESNGGQNSSWSTSNSTFEVTDVSCGMVYTFYVTASNDQCTSKPSSSFMVKTAPCLLTSISAITGCNSSIIHVFWEKTPALPLYTATAEAGNRSTITCSGTAGTCDLMNAECGSQYVITVASSDKCSSKKSTPYKISTAPCTPVDINIDTTCKPDGIRVSWANSSVAQYFLLMVTWSDGKTQTHNTSVNSYTISKLPCGRTYSLSITAFAGNCSTPASSAVTFSTEPCVPTNLQVEMQCYANSSILSWDASEGSEEYFAYAQSSNGDRLHCHSINTTCTFRGLQCGSTYNFSVQASNGICNSSFSKPAEKGAAPCAPDVVRTRLLPMEKQVQIVRVSWEPVHCPNVTYLVDMIGSIEGDPQKLIHVFSYWTQRTFFEILLPCSTKYSVTVQSRNPAGVSKPSPAKSSTTAPCPPLDITIVGDSGWGQISWSHSLFATEYSVFELSAAGRTRVCKTDQLSCALSDVNLTALEVTASNDVGQSNPSRDIFILSRQHARLHPFATDMPTYLHMMNEKSPPEVNVTVDGTSLHIQWTPVQDARRYILSVVEQPDSEPVKELQLFVSRAASTVTDLTPATKHCVSVSAAGDNASSPFSPPVCVVTGKA